MISAQVERVAIRVSEVHNRTVRLVSGQFDDFRTETYQPR